MNNRLLIIDPSGRTLWQYPRPGDLAAAQTFKTPDDAHLTPSGKQIIASEEDGHVVRVIDIATRKIVYTYGMPGVRVYTRATRSAPTVTSLSTTRARAKS